MDFDEGVKYPRVQLQSSSFFYFDFKRVVIKSLFLEFLFKLKHWKVFYHFLRWCIYFSTAAAVEPKSKSLSTREFITDYVYF